MPNDLQAEPVAEGVYRCGTRFVNWYIVEEEGRLTVFDAGLPGYWGQLDRALERLARSSADIAALVLTHGHSDHVGFAERLRSELGVTVWIHVGDEEMVGTGKQQKPEGSPLPYLRHPFAYRFLAHFMRSGGGRIPPVEELSPYRDGERLDVPGGPVAIHAPGHTRGLCALHLEDRGVLIAGDVLCNLHPLRGDTGPQIMPRAFNVDSQQALSSLDRIASLDSGTLLLFGHGDPWTSGPTSAVDQARATGVT